MSALVVDVGDGASVEPVSTALAAQLAAVTEERDEYRKLVRHLREEVERLKRGLLGQKAERLPANDAQLSLMMLGLALGDQAAANAGGTASRAGRRSAHTAQTCAQATARASAAHADRIVPPEVEREPEAFELIGTDVRAVLERRPSATVVLEILYKKFVRKDRTRGG